MKENLKSLRNFIDRIDRKILQLLKRRIYYAKKLRKYKKNPYDPFREKEILEKMKKEKFLPVFREIISLCREAEGGFKIFVPEGSVYPFILKKFFGENIEYEVLKKEEDCLEKAEEKRSFAFLELKKKNLLKLQKRNLKILWLGNMKNKGKKKRFFLAGEELGEDTLKFPASVMVVKKEKSRFVFFEKMVKNSGEFKELKGVSILGIYPAEEEHD